MHHQQRGFSLKLITSILPAGSREIRGMSGLRTKVATTCGRVLLPGKNFSWQTPPPLSMFSAWGVCSAPIISLHCCHKSEIRIRLQEWERENKSDLILFPMTPPIVVLLERRRLFVVCWDNCPPTSCWAWSLKAKQNTNSNKQNISQDAKLT